MQFIPEGPHIPKEVIQAHEDGHLVFFCGAGISYPLGLPDFNGLVDAVRKDLAYSEDASLPPGIPEKEYKKNEENYKRYGLDLISNFHKKSKPEKKLYVQLINGKISYLYYDEKIREWKNEQISKEEWDAVIKKPFPKCSNLQSLQTVKKEIFIITSERGHTPHKNIYSHPDLFLNYLANHLNGRKIDSNKGFVKIKQSINKALKIDNSTKIDYSTHKTLLKLAKQNGNYHLVTTNADRGFHYAAEKLKLENFNLDCYPYLPPATHDDLKYPVHLHGFINEENDPYGKNLIFTSADFGKAYLIDGRATKFIVELFSGTFTILFIGYSLNDPILRYMTDALAQDNRVKNKMFALVSYDTNKSEDKEKIEEHWRFKGVTPILYSDENHHEKLHKTLLEWSRIQNEIGRKEIIIQHSSTDPTILRNTPDKKFIIDQIILALTEQTGEIARYFAEKTPMPPINWLQEFIDAGLLNCEISQKVNCVYSSDNCDFGPTLNNIQKNLLLWIKKHLDNPRLFQMIVAQGNTIHPKLRSIIKSYLDETSNKNSPLSKAWNLLLNLDQHKKTKIPGGSKANIKILLEGITPYMQIIPVANKQEKLQYSENIDVQTLIKIVTKTHDCFNEAYNRLINDKKTLSNVAFKITFILEKFYDTKILYEPNKPYIPSIKEHAFNKDRQKWIKLIDLVRDSWLELLKTNHKKARSLVDYWKDLPYVIFRRLSLYAMAESDLYSSEEMLNYLLLDEGSWLWNLEIKCELYNLLEKKAKMFSQKQINKLIKSVFQSYKKSRQKTEYELYWFFHDINQFKQNKIKLPNKALKFIDQNKGWSRDEWQKRFSIGSAKASSKGENSDFSLDELCQMSSSVLYPKLVHNEINTENLAIYDIPAERLALWATGLNQYPQSGVNMAKYLLEKKHKNYDDKLWRKIFYGLAKKQESWSTLSKAIPKLSKHFFIKEENLHAATWWFNSMANIIDEEQIRCFLDIIERDFLTLDKKTLIFSEDHFDDADALVKAINSSIGQLLESLIVLIDRQVNKVGMLLPVEFKKTLEMLFEYIDQKTKYPYAILGRSLYYLFLIDPKWTKEYIIKKIIPNNDFVPPLAASIWTGYLYNKKTSPDLMLILKKPLLFFIKFACKENILDKEIIKELISFFTYSCLYFQNILKDKDIQPVLAHMNPATLEIVAQTLMLYLKSSKNPDNCWDKQLYPFIKNWPQRLDFNTSSITINFIQIILILTNKQADAFKQLKKYFGELDEQGASQLFVLYLHLTFNKKNKMFLQILEYMTNSTNSLPKIKPHLNAILQKMVENESDISKDIVFNKIKRKLNSC